MKYKFFEPYKNRRIEIGQRVQVYRNLKFKKEAVYSIRDVKSGLVLGHASNLLLTNCWFVVKQYGRERVLREHRKNVHAWIEGDFCAIHAGDDGYFANGIQVKYNPYVNGTFVRIVRNYEIPIFAANLVWIDGNDVSASGF